MKPVRLSSARSRGEKTRHFRIHQAVPVIILMAAFALSGQLAVGAMSSTDVTPSTQGSVTPATTTEGSLSGTVVESSGQPLYNISVTALDGSGNWIGDAYTNAAGYYEIGGLPSGSYKIRFQDWPGNHLTQYYNNRSDLASADFVDVIQGTATTDINASMAIGGSITGTVTDSSGQPLSSSVVGIYTSSGTYVGTVFTDTAGNYSKGRLETGSYKVKFDNEVGNYMAQFYNNKPDLASANLVEVIRGSVTSNINASLATGGSIKGTVTDEAGLPLKNVQVIITKNAGAYGSAYTDAAGRYTVGRLATGSYKAYFYASDSVTQYYNDKPDNQSADWIAVTVGTATTAIDAALVKGGSITGTVTDPSGQPLEGVMVGVYAASGSTFYGSSSTDSAGHYAVRRLAAGDYRVYFLPRCLVPECALENYVLEYYMDRPDGMPADLVAVGKGSVTSDIDASLELGGSISGTVTDVSGQPLQGVSISILSDTGINRGSAITDETGVYRVNQLREGSYRVEFRDWSGIHLTQFYNNKTDLTSSDPVAVAAGGVTGQINASLVSSVSCTHVPPGLSLAVGRAYWASYGDYLAGELSVEYRIDDAAGPDAEKIYITDAVNSNGVLLATEVPYDVAEYLLTGESLNVTLRYLLPPGVEGFRSTLQASAENVCGEQFAYPSHSGQALN